MIDPTVGGEMPKSKYFETLDAKPEAIYTPEQAAINMVRSGNSGPWTPEEVGNRFVRYRK